MLGFPGGSTVKNPPEIQEMWIQSLGREDPLERKWQPTPDRGAWQVTLHGVSKSWPQPKD